MWISEYREAHGMELDDFARAVNRYGHRRMIPRMVCTITDTLVHMLESDKNCVTHPVIANAIAEYCGATPQQRDMIVAEVHRGDWKPRQGVKYARPSQSMFNNVPNGAKPVVKIGMSGNVLAAYESVADAARKELHSEDFIRKCCQRRAKGDMILAVPYTFRFQSEWVAMTREGQLMDIQRHGEVMDVIRGDDEWTQARSRGSST